MNWKILEHYHIDPFEVFSKVGMNPQKMYKPNSSYPLRNILNLCDEMAMTISDPSYGLFAGRCWHPSFLGPLGYALLSSPSLRTTMETFVHYHPFITNQSSTCRLDEDHEAGTLIVSGDPEEARPGTDGREDLFVSIFLAILNMNHINGNLHPVKVCLRRQESKRPGRYYSQFNCPVEFNQLRTSIELKREDVDYVLPTAVEALSDFSKQEMKSYLSQMDRLTFTYRSSLIIEKNFITGTATIDIVANSLKISTKTLQRFLKSEGTTFSEILDNTRAEKARNFLIREESLSEIAYRLGFSEQSAFTRFFKKSTGCTPSEYRAKTL